MDDSTHRIRLRGPWLAADGGRVRLPASWAEALGGAGEGSLSRRFQRGSISTEHDRVTVHAESPHHLLGVTLNAAAIEPGADDVAAMLQDSNTLEVRLRRSEPAGANPASVLEVWLEVEDG
ncbi:hypothetical protein Pla175_18490 [Pirellulimonas nuda]|uniref:Uncharacterized protein n=1 Tax=Pirellulimonas nuda TaxID=2528009 RepID=A0A518DAG0_9BACT|nr:hypothetical protein [Pirellulimonas nuda]QDU88471.1 hypothetical protein Pla175_18490 [Pirellulimonas nuda]